MQDNKNFEFKITKYININVFTYSYKGHLKSEIYSFRFYHKKYKVFFTVNKINILKISNKKENNIIEYSTNNRIHTSIKSKNNFFQEFKKL